MEIKKAEFVISNTDVKACPTNGLPEYAFIGRSNVGKSSLINMLTNRKGLAKTSSKPGKTLLINHFIINDEWYLVDLPGYGYATAGKATREKLKKIIESYILFREELTCLFVLIDCRHEAQPIDLEFMEWLGVSGVPFSIIFTKADKLSRSSLNDSLNAYKEKLFEKWEELPPLFVTSSEKGDGRMEVLDYIESISNDIKK
ncbi:MAG: ribosome biogenesis GTP-binding protein YihA/YsxC [Paludibacter sp.]|jgi:GTP-binding protein|nr:ribosome biogenesis GTP-binding protein YihA/YsxC [Paludibacter sp.]